MASTLFELAAVSKELPHKLFLLPRLLIMSALCDLAEGDLATYRELKALLGLSDGKLYSNLQVLKVMDYILEKKVEAFKFEETAYGATREGRAALKELQDWLEKWKNRSDDHGKLEESYNMLERAGHGKSKTE